MLEEAITLINKQIDMYIIQEQNIETRARTMNIPNRVKRKLRKQIILWQYILKILEKQNKEESKNG